MSSEPHNQATPHSTEHGTTASYVVGFILSLIFTVIPYYLVVNKVIAGSALIGAILGIAVLQMAIQLLFFLHLGRGPKPLYNIIFFFATAGVIVVTIGASLFIMQNLYRTMTPEEIVRKQAQEEGISQVGGTETGACTELYENHIVTIKDGMVTPVYTPANLCDTLTFINEDDEERVLEFGSPSSHSDQQSYGGEYEVMLNDARPESITLNQPGNFVFYDHLDPDLIGQFSVQP